MPRTRTGSPPTGPATQSPAPPAPRGQACPELAQQPARGPDCLTEPCPPPLGGQACPARPTQGQQPGRAGRCRQVPPCVPCVHAPGSCSTSLALRRPGSRGHLLDVTGLSQTLDGVLSLEAVGASLGRHRGRGVTLRPCRRAPQPVFSGIPSSWEASPQPCMSSAPRPPSLTYSSGCLFLDWILAFQIQRVLHLCLSACWGRPRAGRRLPSLLPAHRC